MAISDILISSKLYEVMLDSFCICTMLEGPNQIAVRSRADIIGIATVFAAILAMR